MKSIYFLKFDNRSSRTAGETGFSNYTAASHHGSSFCGDLTLSIFFTVCGFNDYI